MKYDANGRPRVNLQKAAKKLGVKPDEVLRRILHMGEIGLVSLGKQGPGWVYAGMSDAYKDRVKMVDHRRRQAPFN